jgi:hypothetical protein
MNVASILERNEKTQQAGAGTKSDETAINTLVFDKLVLNTDTTYDANVYVRGSVTCAEGKQLQNLTHDGNILDGNYGVKGVVPCPEGKLLHTLTVKGHLTVGGDVKVYRLDVAGNILINWDLDALHVKSGGDVTAYRIICQELEQPSGKSITSVSFIENRSMPNYKTIVRR